MPRRPVLCRVVLLDDHEVVRYGVALHLAGTGDIQLLDNVGTSAELLRILADAPVSVVVMDYVLAPADMGGGALITLIRMRHPGCQIIVLSAHAGIEHLAMAAGAHAFVHKARPLPELVRTIRCLVNSKATQLGRPPAYARNEALPASPASIDHPVLSERERQVLRLWLQGTPLLQIAAQLGTRTNTVSAQKCAAMRKLGITNDNELALAHWLSSLD